LLKSVSEFFGSSGSLGVLGALGSLGSLGTRGVLGALGSLGSLGALGTRGVLGALGSLVALGAGSLCIFNYNIITIIIIYVYIISIISITRYDNIAMKGTNNISGKIVFASPASLLFVSNPKHFIFPSLSKNSFG
jgi:hypothetical protein